MRVVGGKPDASGRREAVIVWTVPGGPADLAGLQQGDKVCAGLYSTMKTHKLGYMYEIMLILTTNWKLIHS